MSLDRIFRDLGIGSSTSREYWRTLENQKACEMYYWKGKYYISSVMAGENGCVSVAPMTKLDENALPAELGQAILDALANYSWTKDAVDWVQGRKRVLQFVGCKSWRGFEKDTIYLLVVLEGGIIDISYMWLNSREGFNKDTHVTCSPMPEKIGEAVMSIIQLMSK